jgi:hypothetical protein
VTTNRSATPTVVVHNSSYTRLRIMSEAYRHYVRGG